MPRCQIQADPPGIPAGRQDEGRRKLENRFVKLFDELRLPVYRYLVQAGLCPEEAEEIAQEAFLRLFKHLLEQGGEENLRSWVFRVAHNLALDHHNDRKRLTLKSPEDWAGLCALLRDQAPNPEQVLLGKERTAEMVQAINSLSGRQLQCVYLRSEGFRYREIASLLKVTMATVAESLRRASRKLRGDENQCRER